MVGAATMRRAAYDPETISMLSSVLERAIAVLPREQRTEDGKARLASSILAAAARGERDPIQLYAAALGGGALSVFGRWRTSSERPCFGAGGPRSSEVPGNPALGEHLPPHHRYPGGPVLLAASAPRRC